MLRVAEDPVNISATSNRPRKKVYLFANKGDTSNEAQRLRTLTSRLHAEFLTFNKKFKFSSFFSVLRSLRKADCSLVIMEGTGLAGGLACLLAKLFFRRRYIVSSGDAIGPFIAGRMPLVGPLFAIYERLLCRFADGFIGWTPYLVGRAMTFGTRRAMTAPGWVIGIQGDDHVFRGDTLRSEWGVSDEAIVFGLVGALNWNRRKNYCYGMELIRAIRLVSRQDVAVVIIGAGSGLSKLREAAGDDLGKRIFLPGPVNLEEVVDALSAMNVGSLPQSTDGAGAFRYTTKIAEYQQSRLPFVTTQIPMAYDLNAGQIWTLPGDYPWSESFIRGLADLMESIDFADIECRRQSSADELSAVFDRERQIDRVTRFVNDILNEDALSK
jgi:glycosyltransferase involved in cell wall biosynthesis